MSRWYPAFSDILTFHDLQIQLFGGSPGVRDMGLVEMGLYRPQTGYYKDIIEEAAALWESFMQNHPFVDGNKRTALDVAFTFLYMNGYEVMAEQKDIIDFIYGLFDKGEVNFKNLDAWLRNHVTRL